MQLFEEAFQATGCKINSEKAPAGGGPAAFSAFIYYLSGGGPSFPNEILVNNKLKSGNVETNRTPEQIAISKRHEKLHVGQWSEIPVLHASPYNHATSVILSPESWVLMSLLTERDAFVKTAWLNALEHKLSLSKTFWKQAMTETVTPEDIDLESGDIRTALKKASLVWDGRLKHNPDPGKKPSITLLDHYIESAISDYENSARLKSKSLPPPVFIRLSPEDILAMGSTFGPSIFGEGTPDEIFTKLPPMPDKLRARLDALKKEHGIESESGLPTIQEVLENPVAYLARSKSYVHVDPCKEKPKQSRQFQEIEYCSVDSAPTPGV